MGFEASYGTHWYKESFVVQTVTQFLKTQWKKSLLWVIYEASKHEDFILDSAILASKTFKRHRLLLENATGKWILVTSSSWMYLSKKQCFVLDTYTMIHIVSVIIWNQLKRPVSHACLWTKVEQLRLFASLFRNMFPPVNVVLAVVWVQTNVNSALDYTCVALWGPWEPSSLWLSNFQTDTFCGRTRGRTERGNYLSCPPAALPDICQTRPELELTWLGDQNKTQHASCSPSRKHHTKSKELGSLRLYFLNSHQQDLMFLHLLPWSFLVCQQQERCWAPPVSNHNHKWIPTLVSKGVNLFPS